MRHALLRRHRRLGERHPEITGKEERIVSEAAAAAGLGEDPAVARCLDQLRLGERRVEIRHQDRKSTRLNSSHGYISYAVFCLKKKKKTDYNEATDTENA